MRTQSTMTHKFPLLLHYSSVCHCVSWSQGSCDASFINVKRIAWALAWARGGGEVANIGSGEEEKSLSLPTLRCPSDCSFTIYKGRGRRSPAQWMTHNFPHHTNSLCPTAYFLARANCLLCCITGYVDICLKTVFQTSIHKTSWHKLIKLLVILTL